MPWRTLPYGHLSASKAVALDSGWDCSLGRAGRQGNSYAWSGVREAGSGCGGTPRGSVEAYKRESVGGPPPAL